MQRFPYHGAAVTNDSTLFLPSNGAEVLNTCGFADPATREVEDLSAEPEADGDYDVEEEVLRQVQHLDEEEDNLVAPPTFSVQAVEPPPPHGTSAMLSSAGYTVASISPVLSAYSLSPNPNGAGGYAMGLESGFSSRHHGYPAPPPPMSSVHYTESPAFLPTRSPSYTFASTSAKLPPPSYDAVTSSTTSLQVRSGEVSPLSAPLHFYAPPAPAAHQDTLLVRNANGVFLLQPALKPAPPYTPPAGSTGATPPSPLPQYTLPPSAATASLAGSGAAAKHAFTPPQTGSASGGPFTPSLGVAPPPYNAPLSPEDSHW